MLIAILVVLLVLGFFGSPVAPFYRGGPGPAWGWYGSGGIGLIVVLILLLLLLGYI